MRLDMVGVWRNFGARYREVLMVVTTTLNTVNYDTRYLSIY
jgi:hypothetical protein